MAQGESPFLFVAFLIFFFFVIINGGRKKSCRYSRVSNDAKFLVFVSGISSNTESQCGTSSYTCTFNVCVYCLKTRERGRDLGTNFESLYVNVIFWVRKLDVDKITQNGREISKFSFQNWKNSKFFLWKIFRIFYSFFFY